MADERPTRAPAEDGAERDGTEQQQPPLNLFEPATVDGLLRGWQLHVSRRREIHERAARWTQTWSYWIGTPTAVLAALAGSSAVAAWQSEGANGMLAFIGGALGLAAAMLASVQTFLNLGARAEQHRQAANAYNKLLRSFERIPASPEALPKLGDDSPLSRELRQFEAELAEVDTAAPVVPEGLAKEVESRLVKIATTACEMAPAPDDVAAVRRDGGARREAGRFRRWRQRRPGPRRPA